MTGLTKSSYWVCLLQTLHYHFIDKGIYCSSYNFIAYYSYLLLQRINREDYPQTAGMNVTRIREIQLQTNEGFAGTRIPTKGQ